MGKFANLNPFSPLKELQHKGNQKHKDKRITRPLFLFFVLLVSFVVKKPSTKHGRLSVFQDPDDEIQE